MSLLPRPSHAILIGLSFAVAWLVMRVPFIEKAEWQTLDWRTALRAHYQQPPDPRLALVLFDDHSEEGLGAWPVDRAVHAQLMQLLALAKPATIAWDIIFQGPGRSEEGDALLAEIARLLQAEIGTRVVSAAHTTSEPVPGDSGATGPTLPIGHIDGDRSRLSGDANAILPYNALRANTVHGYAECPPENDGVRRAMPVLVRVGDAVYPSFGLQTLLSYFKVPASAVRARPGASVEFEAQGRTWRIPIDQEGRCWVNYRYDKNPQFDRLKGAYDLPTYSYANLRNRIILRLVEEKKEVALPELDGKILLVGLVVEGKADAGATPLSGYSPLTLLHANFCDNVLRQDPVRRWPDWAVCGCLALLGCGGAGLLGRRRAWWLGAGSVLALAAYLELACFVWIRWSLWLPVVAPSLGLAGASFFVATLRLIEEQRAKDRIRGMFNSYLSQELLDKMLKSGRVEIRSERRPVTILFSDLRDFTAWSEKAGEEELISQLNEYLGAMVECIHAEGGTLHKFIGDAVMAAWGDLDTAGPEEDAARACRAALRMLGRLRELNASWEAAGRHTLDMGIGLNHGVVLVGNVGSPRRMEYTLIGDPVNLASRLEGMNKQLHTEILVGDSVHVLAGRHFAFRAMGQVAVKGKAQPVAVFELQGAIAGGDAGKLSAS